MKFIPIILLTLFVIYGATNKKSYLTEPTAELIVTNLYEVMGDKTLKKPNIRISTTATFGAKFESSKNLIVVEQKLYNICTTFGKDSLSALAFVIGHELGHFHYQEDGVSYIEKDNHIHENIAEEHNADVYGMFNAYLAGYESLDIIPNLIDEIYKEYSLKNTISKDYPSLTHRKATAIEVLEEVKELINIFELANYLSIIGEYEYAITAYERIAEKYKGREIYNNLGLAYLLEAINFTEKNHEPYLYPLEIDSRKRLQKAKPVSGGKSLSIRERRIQLKLLSDAIKNFNKVGRLDPNYGINDINKVCALLLMGKTDEAIIYFDNKVKHYKSEKTLLLSSLIEVVKGNEEAAAKIWQTLAKHPNRAVAAQSAYNLSVLQGGVKVEKTFPKGPPNSLNPQIIDGVKLSEFTAKKYSNYDEIGLSIIPMEKSVVYVFNTDRHKFVFQRIFNINKKERIERLAAKSIISTQNGFYISCLEKKTVALLTADGEILEWGQYYKNLK